MIYSDILLGDTAACPVTLGVTSSLCKINADILCDTFRVPTVMESQRKSWKTLWSWKIMEKSLKITKISKVMEK